MNISSTQLYSFWMLAFSALIIGLRLAAELTGENYEYNPLHAGLMTLLPIPFCAFFVLTIFAAEMNVSSEF